MANGKVGPGIGNWTGARPKRTLALASILVALVLVSAACSDGGSSSDDAADTVATSTTAARPATPRDRLTERPCDTAATIPDVACYWLEVPERRDVDGARTIRLWVAVVAGTGTAKGQPPYLDLTGGPGDTASTPWVGGDADLTDRDGGHPTLVVVDQRGTGRSEPRLACPELDEVSPRSVPYPKRVAARRQGVQACRDRLVDEGVDLDGYDTTESAADLVDLRRALGYDQWVVRGFSYGGRLAQELYRQDPEGVAGLILDSTLTTEPWTLQQVVDGAEADIDRIDAACAAAPSCAGNGSFADNVEAAAAALDAKPYPVPSTDLVVDGGLLRSGLFQALYDQELVPALPVFASAIANGQPSVIDAVAPDLVPIPETDIDAPASGTFQVVSCADEGGQPSEGDQALLADPGPWGDVVVNSYPFCDVWKVGPARAGGLLPARGDVPVLAVVGGLDPVHPRSFTEATTTGLPNTTIVEVPAGAHGNALTNPCTRSITFAFRAAPQARIDTSCVASLPQPFR